MWRLTLTPSWLWFLPWASAGEMRRWNVRSFSFSAAEMSAVSQQGRAPGPGGCQNRCLPAPEAWLGPQALLQLDWAPALGLSQVQLPGAWH